MKIIDNFIDQQSFDKIKDSMFGTQFPWYYNSSKSLKDDDYNFQFVHNFVYEKKILTPFWKLLLPVVNKLKVKEILRVKAKKKKKKNINYKYPMHIDTGIKGHKTAVFYVNTNNGGTIFLNGKKTNSVANRLVEFDSHQKHAAVDCTDEKVRVVVNFNYTIV